MTSRRRDAFMDDVVVNEVSRSEGEKLLIASLAHRDFADLALIKELYAKCNDRLLFELAKEHELEGIVGERLVAVGRAHGRWLEAIADWKYTMRCRLDELDALAEALAAKGIELVALKNAGIARGIYPYLSECPMGDIDLLVSKKDFVAAHEILLSLDYVPAFRVADTIEELGLEAALLSGGAEYKKDLSDDILWLELQWRPIAGRWISPEVEAKAEDLLQRAVAIEESDVKLLAPVDNLLQVCLHTAKHSYIRAPGLRLHSDVDRIVRFYDKAESSLDWGEFTERVEAMNLRVAVYFSLWIAHKLLGTPIPGNVLQRLKPSKWQEKAIWRALLRGGFFHPQASKFTRLQYLRFTALLFDNPRACLRSAFPSQSYMMQHYELGSKLQLPKTYAKRFFSLLFKRVRT